MFWLRPDVRQELAHVDGQHRIKFLRGFSRKYVRAGRITEALYFCLDLFSGQGVEPHDRFLAFVEVGSFQLFHLREQLHLGKIEDLCHFHAGWNLVTLLNIRGSLAEAAAPARSVLQNRNQSRHGRQHSGLLDAPPLAVYIDLCFAALFAQYGQLGLALLQARFDVLFQLLLAAFGLFEGKNVLARVDCRDQLIFLDLQLGAPNSESGLDELHVVLALADFQVGSGFLQLFIDPVDFELSVFHRGLPFGIIKLHDEVARRREGAGGSQLRNLRRRSQVRSRQRKRAHGLQFTPKMRLDDQVPAPHRGQRELLFFPRDLLYQVVPARHDAGQDDENQEPRCDFSHKELRRLEFLLCGGQFGVLESNDLTGFNTGTHNDLTRVARGHFDGPALIPVAG